MFLKKPFFLLIALVFSLSGYSSSHVWVKTADISLEKSSKNYRKQVHEKKCQKKARKDKKVKKIEKKKEICKNKQTAEPEPFKAGYPLEKNQVPSGYNYPGRINVIGKWDFTVSASLIYWQMLADQFNFIWDFKTEQNVIRKVNWDYKYKPGFQVELGMYFGNHDDWKLFAEYIRYHAHNHISKSLEANIANEELVLPLWAGGMQAGDSMSAEGHMHLSYDAWHLMLSRPYYLGNHLICDFGFGLRAWTINHELNTSMLTFPTIDPIGPSVQFDSRHECKAWALGPRAFFDAKFLLGCGWKLDGKGALSLLYRHNHARSKIVPYGPEEQPLTSLYIDNANLLSPELELGLGLGWGTYMNHQKQHIEFIARYDWQVFWNHKMILDFENNFFTADLPSSSLFLHGLTITTTFDF